MLDMNFDYPKSSGRSWTLLSNTTAVKTADESLIKSKSTGIPKEIISFFLNDKKLEKQESKAIDLIIANKKFNVDIRRNEGGRYLLKLSNLSTILTFKELVSSEDTIWFERDVDKPRTFNFYSRSKNPKNSYKPKQNRSRPTETESMAYRSNRIGQSFFRAEVIDKCLNKCVVTGVSEQETAILIASHIKPWASSSDDERMDGNNGLLLAPHIDKLFDKFLITFSENGKIKACNKTVYEILNTWGIAESAQYNLSNEQQNYMVYHRAIFEKKRRERLIESAPS